MKVERKKKSDQRRKEQQKIFEILKNSQICRRTCRMCSKRSGSRSLQDPEQTRNDLLPEHQHLQQRSQKLQSPQDQKTQCQKNLSKWAGDNERIRTEIEERRAMMEELGQKKKQKESMGEVELDEETRGLQAGDERRGSSASQSHGCCSDTAIFQQLFALGTKQALQQTSTFQRVPTQNLRRSISQRQPLGARPRWKKEETKMRRSRGEGRPDTRVRKKRRRRGEC